MKVLDGFILVDDTFIFDEKPDKRNLLEKTITKLDEMKFMNNKTYNGINLEGCTRPMVCEVCTKSEKNETMCKDGHKPV